MKFFQKDKTMKNTKKLCLAFSICAAAFALVVLTGCKGVDYIKFSNTIPGEYNLAGVSKIAVIDFNSLPDDPVNGVYAVDAATKQIMEGMIAAKFFKGKTYKVADLDAEKDIVAANKAAVRLAQRFDAVLYGRVWWDISNEYKNIHPVVYTLEKWKNEKYMSGRTDDGRPVYSVAHLTESMTDVKVDHAYRAAKATLMLSLTIYRMNKDGKVEKIVEDFAVAEQDYLLDNGVFSTTFVPHDKARVSQFERISAKSANEDAKNEKAAKEKAGFIDENQNASTIPTPLQTKVMLGKKLTDALGKKLTNTEVPVEAEFFGKYIFFEPMDEVLLNKIIAGNFNDSRAELVAMLRKAAGYAICDRIGSISSYEKNNTDEENNTKVAADPGCFEDLKNAKDAEEKAEIEEEIDELVGDTVEDFENEIYALAICEEACGRYEHALENYRTLMKYCPEEIYALGISRCLISLDMADRLYDISKDAKKAAKKAKVN